jgi:hypothetical protein
MPLKQVLGEKGAKDEDLCKKIEKALNDAIENRIGPNFFV